MFELQGDFETEVLAESRATPVLVDFWAAWCGPCRVLGPVLEKLAREANGRWRLVKVDTEQHAELAQRFGIRGIPAVKLFQGGGCVAEFTGALPEPEVRRWLSEHLPRPGDKAFAQALEHLERGEREAAARALENVVSSDPERHAARVHLARLVLETDPARAYALAAGVPDGVPDSVMAQHVTVLARLLRWSAGEAFDIPGRHEAREADLALYREAAQALRAGDPSGALEKWVTLISRNRTLDDDGARRACIALFALRGENDEVTRMWRRRFSMALH